MYESKWRSILYIYKGKRLARTFFTYIEFSIQLLYSIYNMYFVCGNILKKTITYNFVGYYVDNIMQCMWRM